jgi:hypothetical protein
MPYGSESCGLWSASTKAPKVGRPKRNRAKVKAGRKAARGG